MLITIKKTFYNLNLNKKQEKKIKLLNAVNRILVITSLLKF